MITEDYVSFETAKLLKENGFDEYCKSVYYVGSVCSVASLGYHDNEGYGAIIEEKQNSDFGKYDNAISAPTIQMAMKWLRDKGYIIVVRHTNNNGYFGVVEEMEEGKEVYHFDGYNSFEEACEAAIKYCLENLI